MPVLAPITLENLALFREIRLRALEQDPGVFGSTYAREAALAESEWAARVRRWNGERGIGFLAMDGEAPCGLAGALLEEADPLRAQLVSMWTAPTHRRAGVGRLLVEGVLGWASSRCLPVIYLSVVNNNSSAIRFYETLGFTRTGKTTPYPNDAALFEYEMSRRVDGTRAPSV